jgi:peptidoglycan/LPS O-acetylase OafA/YrhL
MRGSVLKLTITSGNRVSEVKALTGLRGIAALYVVLFHFFSPLPLTSHGFCFLGHGYLAVDIFFTLSGFVMALNYAGLFSHGIRPRQLRVFFCRRIARIYPLYLLTLVVATAMVARGYLTFGDRSLFQAFGPNLLMIQNWGNWNSIETPAWSISTEWFAYLLFPFVLRWIFFRSRIWTILLTTLSVGALCWLSREFSNPYDKLKVLDLTHAYPSIIRCSAEFILGIAAYRIKSTRFKANFDNWRWPIFVLSPLICGLLFFKKTDLVFVLLLPLFISTLDARKSIIGDMLGSRSLEFLGLISFSIYLLHYLLVPVLDALDRRIRHFGYSHSHSYAVLVVFPVLLVSATATYYWIEIPARIKLRSTLEGQASAMQQS